MSMKRFAFRILLGAFLVPSFALGQLTPEQLKLKEEILKQQGGKGTPGKADPIENYKSPVKFTEQDPGFFLPPDGSQPPVEIADTAVDGVVRPAAALKLFGYNMFEGTPESFSPVLEATPPQDYRLGPGDNILVNVWGRVDLQLDLTVDREGKVFIPKAGEISAWGRTLDEFQDQLDRQLSAIYSDFQLSVTLGRIRRNKIFVYGEVKRPGGYTTSSLATLFNALYLAGGPSETGSLRKIKHLRHNKVVAEIDLYRFLVQGDNSQDSKLESGDVIFVPVVGPLVTISGQVKRPAIYEIWGNEKISDLIALAGGATAEALLEKLFVDRIGPDDNRLVYDVDLSESTLQTNPQVYSDFDLALRDGDRIRVPSAFDLWHNIVKIMGNVKHPGVFGLRDSMRVIDLIDGGEQLQNNTYMERANLIRTYPDQRREVYPVNLAQILAGDDSTNFLLMDNDSLAVYSENEIRRNMNVSIFGTVKHPGMYEFFENMRLSDLVFISGNTLKQSYMLQAEIARARPGQPSEIIHMNLEQALCDVGSSDDPLLEEDDIVFVRTIPRWRIENTVFIEGEVMFPGGYALTKEGERLADLLARCGGFTPDAFKRGTVFIRGSISEEIEKRQIRSILASNDVIFVDSLNRAISGGDHLLNLSSADRIVINIDEALKNPNSPDNVLLQRGDRVFVPGKPAGVQVLGAIAMNGTIVFKRGKHAGYYIKSSGGFSKSADKGQTRLAKASGHVYFGAKAFNSDVEPGDVIVVPQKIKREKSFIRTSSSIAAVASSFLTALLLVDRLR
jgi:protein involved in polysaccharide export with SLBB domain